MHLCLYWCPSLIFRWDSEAPSSSSSEAMSIDSDDSQYVARRHAKRKEKEKRKELKRREAKAKTPVR